MPDAPTRRPDAVSDEGMVHSSEGLLIVPPVAHDENGASLRDAVVANDIHRTIALLRQGIDADRRDDAGRTPLHIDNSSAVVPSALDALGFAPRSSSANAVAVWPCSTATRSGVSPESLVRASRSAPVVTNNLTSST